MNISQAVALRVYKLLKEKKWSQYRLANESNLSHETLKSIMKGKTKGVNLKTVVAIADGFGMKVDEFLHSKLFWYENLDMN